MIFRSVARVSDDRPDTHRLRLADEVDDDEDDEVAFDLLLVVVFELLAAVDDLDDDSGNTAGGQRADRNVWLIWMAFLLIL